MPPLYQGTNLTLRSPEALVICGQSVLTEKNRIRLIPIFVSDDGLVEGCFDEAKSADHPTNATASQNRRVGSGAVFFFAIDFNAVPQRVRYVRVLAVAGGGFFSEAGQVGVSINDLSSGEEMAALAAPPPDELAVLIGEFERRDNVWIFTAIGLAADDKLLTAVGEEPIRAVDPASPAAESIPSSAQAVVVDGHVRARSLPELNLRCDEEAMPSPHPQF
jgi:hypothetical protein